MLNGFPLWRETIRKAYEISFRVKCVKNEDTFATPSYNNPILSVMLALILYQWQSASSFSFSMQFWKLLKQI